MPLFKIDIEKEVNGYFWTNVYHVDASSLAAALGCAAVITQMEQSFHFNFVNFTKQRASTAAPNDENFLTQPLATTGERATNADINPLFDVIRVDYGATGGGRPSRKFYRGCLIKNNWSSGGVIEESTRQLIVDAYVGVVGDLDELSASLVDVDGQALVSAVVIPKYTNRQLRRGSKRQQNQVLP